MSKTKALKKKTTGFDIMYRIITAILAVAIYPAVYFVDFFTFEIQHTDISDLLNKFTDGSKLHTTYDSISFYELPQLLNSISNIVGEDIDVKSTILENVLYRPVIVAAIFLVLALVIGLVILGFAIFSNKIKVITALSGSGFLCTLIAYISFTVFFAEPVIDGEITIAQLFNLKSTILSMLIPYVGEVTTFALCGGFFAVLFLLLGICVWSVSVMVVNVGEEKEKQMKKNAKAK